MKSPIVQYSLGFVTAALFVAIAAYFGLIPGFSGGHRQGPTVVEESVSPDGQYGARRERISNNLDWFEERMTINRSGERGDWEREYVFMNQCQMPVKMQWIDSRKLQISYGFDASGKAHVYRRAFSKDRKVAIDYRLDDGGSL